MEKKKKNLLGIEGVKDFTKMEKRCNRCGFVTFYLRVLYTHKYKCQGKLLGCFSCCYCRRKFDFLSSYHQHKKTCVKQHWKKTILLQKKLKIKSNKILTKSSKKSTAVTKPCTIACPMCLKLFSSKLQYQAHTKKGSCVVERPLKKETFSARKSFSNVTNVKDRKGFQTKVLKEWKKNNEDSYIENNLCNKTPFKKANDLNFNMDKNSGYICMWCKNIYPSKEILLKHFQKNSQCASAHYRQNSHNSSKKSFTARKSMNIAVTRKINSVVARKSFPHSKHRLYPVLPYKNDCGSARKSLPTSGHKSLNKNKMRPFGSPNKAISCCPVCYENFSDPFEFLQHQKKVGHWGRAAKSFNSNCKCPFCEKDFFSVRARNAHVCNHAEKSAEEIEYFLKSTTCNLCSQIFISESIKQQHVKIAHAKRFEVNSIGESSKAYPYHKEEKRKRHSLLPLIMKQKLKEYPNTCPICSKDFSSTHFRNRHFQEKHLDSQLECKFCPLKFNSIDNLEYHMQESHYESFKFECLACKINLATAPHVVLHVTKVHSDQNPKNIIRCRVSESISSDPQANDTAYSLGNLDKIGSGIQLHQGKSDEFYCDICGITFQKLCGLASHRQSKLHRDTLVKNLDEMHKSLSNLPPSPPPAPKKHIPQPEILACSECSAEFTSIKDFVPHRLSHFGVKGKYMKINEMNIYTCEICGEESDSHSKVQMHLFWHLQVESTSSEKNSVKDRKKNDPIVPDRLSGQHVAKKSFSKQNSEAQQEVVIGGVKKSLFTCESCKIGFTTQAHYSLHVRRFCKMRNTPATKVSFEEPNQTKSSPVKQEINESQTSSNNSSVKEITHCSTCCCLFYPSIAKVHDELCEKFSQTSLDFNSRIIPLKSNMELQNAVAACIACNSLFDNTQKFSEHMLTHRNSTFHNDEDDADKDIYCVACNCLFFSSDALENHEIVCSNFSYNDFDINQHKDVLTAVSKLDNAVAVCITCCLAFSSDQNLNEHITMHNDKLSLRSDHHDVANNSLLESKSLDDDVSVQLNSNNYPNNENNLSETTVPSLLQNCAETEYNLDPTKNISNIDNFSDSFPNSSSSTIPSTSEIELVSVCSLPAISDTSEDDPINKLRENFSQLLCILINDPDLMHQLGYGEQPVDDVLTNVLQQMGQIPILKDGQISDLDCLRKNIQILLDFCLKDQIMELIGNGKASTDDIVIEALKMFSNDDNIPLITAE